MTVVCTASPIRNINREHTNHMSLSNGRRRGLESSGPMKRQKSHLESGERGPGRRGGPGWCESEGVVERDAAEEQVRVDRTVTRDGPGDDVSAVVRARAGVLAEI